MVRVKLRRIMGCSGLKSSYREKGVAILFVLIDFMVYTLFLKA